MKAKDHENAVVDADKFFYHVPPIGGEGMSCRKFKQDCTSSVLFPIPQEREFINLVA